MWKRRVLVLSLASLLLVGGWLLVASGREPDRKVEELALGKPRSAVVRAGDDWRRRFTLVVPPDALALRIEVHSPHAELGLHADWDELHASGADCAYSTTTDGGVAELVVDRFSEPALRHGRLALEVSWEAEGVPRSPEHVLDELDFTILPASHAPSLAGTLAPGQSLASVLAPKAAGARSFRIDVPSGLASLRLDLAEVTGDLDLYARAGRAVGDIDGGVRFSSHLWGRESLILGDDEALGAGPWFVDVVDVHHDERALGFRLWCHAGTGAPAELSTIPALPVAHAGPLGAALASVVELFGEESTGSGTLISPEGWILTNAHVVTAMGGGREARIVVACTLDPHDAPVELFRAELARFDERRDLALLRIVSGFYGQPLPAAYSFPALRLGRPEELAIGDPLWLIGYPSTGGLGSLVTLHCTRGIVSGFDRSEEGVLLKTDAGIAGGSSGGAAIDARGWLVGVPTSLVELASGQAGYVHPWTWAPLEWLEQAKPLGWAPQKR